MEITNPRLNQYAEQHTSPESDLLRMINRTTNAEVFMPRMLSGHLQGRFLSMISSMVRPMNILEIGTYTGYSAICLAEGLRDGGKIITIDVNEELEARVKDTFAGNGAIDYRVGDARQIIPTLSGPFELVWIDADKENYAHYYDLIIDKVPRGGFILADNVLWSGKVLNEKQDKDTRAIRAFNRKVHNDPQVKNVLLPVRDGIMMIQKM
jgi:caffeoyl-CoA O-methyltransferase